MTSQDQAIGNSKTLFIMDGAREVIAQNSGMQTFELQVDGLEKSIAENPSLAIDLSKTLVETACQTIMKDRGVKTEKKAPSLNELLTATLTSLQLVNPFREDEADVVKHLRSVSKGLVNAF